MKKFVTINKLKSELEDKRVVLQAKQTELEQIQAWVADKQSQIDKLEALMEDYPELVESESVDNKPAVEDTVVIKKPSAVKKEKPADKPIQKQAKKSQKPKEDHGRFKDFSSLKV